MSDNNPNATPENKSLNSSHGLSDNAGADSNGLINRCDKADLENQLSAQLTSLYTSSR